MSTELLSRVKKQSKIGNSEGKTLYCDSNSLPLCMCEFIFDISLLRKTSWNPVSGAKFYAGYYVYLKVAPVDSDSEGILKML